MSYASPPNLWEYPSLLYRTKSFELNRYYIEHPVVHGFLNMASIPVNILSVVPDKLPPDVVIADDNRYIVTSTAIVSFVNKNAKRPPTPTGRQQAHSAKKTGLLDYIIKEQTDEPWNEYVVQDSHNKLLRMRTILTDVSYYDDIVDRMGDPLLETKQTVAVAVTSKASPESGMT